LVPAVCGVRKDSPESRVRNVQSMIRIHAWMCDSLTLASMRDIQAAA